jgi:hypothetical protein
VPLPAGKRREPMRSASSRSSWRPTTWSRARAVSRYVRMRSRACSWLISTSLRSCSCMSRPRSCFAKTHGCGCAGRSTTCAWAAPRKPSSGSLRSRRPTRSCRIPLRCPASSSYTSSAATRRRSCTSAARGRGRAAVDRESRGRGVCAVLAEHRRRRRRSCGSDCRFQPLPPAAAARAHGRALGDRSLAAPACERKLTA